MNKNKKNIALFAGIFGWAVLAFFSFWNIKKIFSLDCFFLCSWPFCGDVNNFWPTIWQGLILIFIFFALVYYGYVIFQYWSRGEALIRSWIFPIALVAAAVLMMPFASNDTQFYYSLGKAVHNGVNPYAQSWNIENKFNFPSSITQTVGVMYGPLTLDLFSRFYQSSGDNVVNFIILWKIFMVLIFALCGYLIYSMIKPQKDKKLFYIFWLSQPLILFEWIGNGHFDGLWLMFLLLAFIFAEKKSWWAVVVCLFIGAWIKFIPLLLSPIFLLWWWQDVNKKNWLIKILNAAAGLIGAAVVSVLAWWPYWQGIKVFQALVIQSKWAVQSLFAAVYYSLKPVAVYFLADNAHWYLTRILQSAILLLAVYFIYPLLKQMWQIVMKKISWTSAQFISASFICLTVYFLIWQKSFWPWYSAMLIPLGLIVYAQIKNEYLGKILLWLSLAPLFFYVPWMMLGGDAGRLTYFWFVFVLVAAYPLVRLWQWRRIDYRL